MNTQAKTWHCAAGLMEVIDPRDLQPYRRWLLISGVFTVLLGVAALSFPLWATLASELAIGWILVAASAFYTIHALHAHQWRGSVLNIAGALLTFLCGLLLIGNPYAGAAALTVLLGAMFAVTGVARLVFALRLRPAKRWTWLLSSGVLSLLLALIVVLEWPASALWFLGVLVGVDLLFSGVCLAGLGLSLRRVDASAA